MERELCWVVLECLRGKMLRESLEALAAGLSFQKQYGMENVVVWTGARPENEQLEYLASLDVRRLICLEGAGEENKKEEVLLSCLQELYREQNPWYVFFGASPVSLSLAAKLAALLDVGYAAKVTYLRKVGNTLSLTHPLMQGALSEVLRFRPPNRGLVSMHPRAFDVPEPPDNPPAERLVPEVFALTQPQEQSMCWEILASTLEPPAALAVEDAEVVVAGGKGMGSEKGFGLLHELAGRLGGAVAASRIAVDLGWAPKERLVGQTGKKVFPDLYIACGISGAHQHQAGMKGARHILAVNTDPQAPIFQIATWSILGDAQQVVSRMIEQLMKAQKAEGER